ncbi:MAG: hypothetical protein IJR88_06045 [Clostridia bacterium]|nr:hypothetical protein [Clostridia bacterium]
MKSAEFSAPIPGDAGLRSAEDLKKEVELYRTLAEHYQKQARRRGIFALLFCMISALGTVAIAVIAILAWSGVFGVRWFLLLAYLGLALLCLLTGLLFFNGRHDSRDLSIDCFEEAEKSEKKLKAVLERQRAAKEKARREAVRVVEVLPRIPMSKTRRVSTALRTTSSILSILYALAIPVASIAALYQSKPKKEKQEEKKE